MMPDRPIDPTLLSEFEQGLNVRWPEKSRIPARVLGYGEISTVLEIQSARAQRLAYKRMPMFRNEDEVTRYEALYREYLMTEPSWPALAASLRIGASSALRTMLIPTRISSFW